MHLWDWRTGSLDSESGIFACAFDQSESRLLTAEADKTIKVYKEDDTAVSSVFHRYFKVEKNQLCQFSRHFLILKLLKLSGGEIIFIILKYLSC